jgi:hypothetical protein
MHFASAIGWTPLGAYTQNTDYKCTSTMCYGVGGKGPTFEAFQTALKNKAQALGFASKLPSGATSFASDGKIGKDTVFLTGWVASALVGRGATGPALKEIALAVSLDLLTKEQVAALVGDLLSELTPVAPVATMPDPISILSPKTPNIMTFRPPTTSRPPASGGGGTVYQAATLPATDAMQPITPAGPSTALLIGASVLGALAILSGVFIIARGRGGGATAGIDGVDGVDAMRQYRDAIASPHNWSNKELEMLAHRMEIQAATRDSSAYQERASKLRRLVAIRKA